MRPKLRRASAITTATVALAIGALGHPERTRGERRHFSVPAGQAGLTLVLFADQSDRFVSYDFAQVHTQWTQAIQGEFETIDALCRMLKGSGLAYQKSPLGSLFVGLANDPLYARYDNCSEPQGWGPDWIQPPVADWK